MNLKQDDVVLNHSGNSDDDTKIEQDLYNLKNGMLMALTLNREKKLFHAAKQKLMQVLSGSFEPRDKDFERYLLYAEEL